MAQALLNNKPDNKIPHPAWKSCAGVSGVTFSVVVWKFDFNPCVGGRASGNSIILTERARSDPESLGSQGSWFIPDHSPVIWDGFGYYSVLSRTWKLKQFLSREIPGFWRALTPRRLPLGDGFPGSRDGGDIGSSRSQAGAALLVEWG